MRILLSNDDGVDAPGLAALHDAMSDLGEVTVVAPESPQSAAGHSITLRRALEVRRVDLAGGRKVSALSVAGRPADCVRLAIRKLLDKPPDLVLSGINAGPNVGINVFYSGTVAAAAEAAMLGIPAVAFSAAGAEQADYGRVGMLCRWVLEQLLADGLTAGDLLNVNIPDLGRFDGAAPRGVRVVPQSTAELEDAYMLEPTAEAPEAYRLSDDYSFAPGQENNDVACLFEGFITVTPLHVDMTNHDRMATLVRQSWPAPPGQ